MELISCQVPDNFTLFDLSDIHLGSPACAEETLCEVVDLIGRTKNARVIFKGDAIEAILPNDKRYLHSCVKEGLLDPKAQADRVIDIFKPISARILAWGIGNHELKLWNVLDFGKYIAGELRTQYGAYNYKLTFLGRDGKLMFKTYHTHGMGGLYSGAKDQIQYDANRRAALKHKLAKSGHADVIYMSRGHDHQLLTVDPTSENTLFLTDDGRAIHQCYRSRIAQDSTYIPPDSRWYATTGSFRRLYSKPGLGHIDYGEVAGYAPSEIGYVKVEVRDRQIVSVNKVVA